MELPLELKTLYKHWPKHTKKSRAQAAILLVQPVLKQKAELIKDSKLKKEIIEFIGERVRIWEKKSKGESMPYTKDQILSTYRFCNIFRELDRQTIEFHTLLKPLEFNFPVWLLNMFYCRMVARTETIKLTGFLSFDQKNNKEVFKRLSNTPRPRFGTPYVFPINTIMKSKTPTRELFLTEYVPSKMKAVANEIQKWDKMSVYDGVARTLPIFGVNLHFLWTEVLIDVAYQFPERIDLFKRFPIGPGSAPTLKRINAHDPKEFDPSITVQRLAEAAIETDITCNSEPLVLSAENWEGIGCEFRKYTNLQNGGGRKRLYKNG